MSANMGAVTQQMNRSQKDRFSIIKSMLVRNLRNAGSKKKRNTTKLPYEPRQKIRTRRREQEARVAVWIKAQPLTGVCPRVLLKAWLLAKSARSKGHAVLFMVQTELVGITDLEYFSRYAETPRLSSVFFSWSTDRTHKKEKKNTSESSSLRAL